MASNGVSVAESQACPQNLPVRRCQDAYGPGGPGRTTPEAVTTRREAHLADGGAHAVHLLDPVRQRGVDPSPFRQQEAVGLIALGIGRREPLGAGDDQRRGGVPLGGDAGARAGLQQDAAGGHQGGGKEQREERAGERALAGADSGQCELQPPHPSRCVIRSATRPAVGAVTPTKRPSARNSTRSAGSHRVVRHHHHGLPKFGDLPQQHEDLLAGPGVQRSGRLVGEDDLRAGHQRPGDGHALLLAAGELRRTVPGLIGEPDLVEHRTQPGGVGLGAGQPQRRLACAAVTTRQKERPRRT